MFEINLTEPRDYIGALTVFYRTVVRLATSLTYMLRNTIPENKPVKLSKSVFSVNYSLHS